MTLSHWALLVLTVTVNNVPFVSSVEFVVDGRVMVAGVVGWLLGGFKTRRWRKGERWKSFN